MIVEDSNLPVAIYNAEAQRLEYIANSIAEASRIIFGTTNVTSDEKIRYALKNKKRINKAILGYIVAIRVANTKQVAELGRKKFIKKGNGNN
jgi:hypothetical protein